MDEQHVQLVLRARTGDKEAFGCLAEQSWARLVRLARSMVGEAGAEDAVQDGLMAAWRRLSQLDKPASFDAWVTRIVFRTCLSRGRRRVSQTLDIENLAETSGASQDSGIWVEQVLSRLAPKQRAVLHLTLVEGQTDSEIAGVMGITPASVRSHRRRARSSLESLMKDWNYETR